MAAQTRSVFLGVGTLLAGIILIGLVWLIGFFRGDIIGSLVSLLLSVVAGVVVLAGLFLIVLGAILLWI